MTNVRVATQPTKAGPAMQPITLSCRPEVMEVGPILHAARYGADGNVTVTPGGIPNLFKSPGDDAAFVGTPLDSFQGRSDVAGNGETQALIFSVENPDLRILMTVVEGLYGIVGRRSAGINSVADLRGKRIATFVETTAAFYIHRMLRTVGLTESDVTIVASSQKEITQALVSGAVDAIAIWEPENSRALELLGDDAIEFSDPSVYRERFNLNTTAAALRDPAKRRSIVAFVRAVIESAKISEHSPRAVWDLVAASSGYDVSLVGKVWPRHRFVATLPADLLDVLEDEEIWLAKQRHRKPRDRQELASLIDASVLAEARATAG